MKAKIFEIKRFAVHDGDGIRTTVFFKGCPLRCVWCHNPEGLSALAQDAFYPHKCVGCGACKKDGFSAESCLGEARVIYGKDVTVYFDHFSRGERKFKDKEELFAQIARDCANALEYRKKR